jgi:hypothetical protein
MACQLPAETGVPLSRWSCPELATRAWNGASPPRLIIVGNKPGY